MWWIIGVSYLALSGILLWFLCRAGRLSARAAADEVDELIESPAGERPLRH